MNSVLENHHISGVCLSNQIKSYFIYIAHLKTTMPTKVLYRTHKSIATKAIQYIQPKTIKAGVKQEEGKTN